MDAKVKNILENKKETALVTVASFLFHFQLTQTSPDTYELIPGRNKHPLLYTFILTNLIGAIHVAVIFYTFHAILFWQQSLLNQFLDGVGRIGHVATVLEASLQRSSRIHAAAWWYQDFHRFVENNILKKRRLFTRSTRGGGNWVTGRPTLPKTNMEPENASLEKEKHLPNLHFWVPC